MESFHRAADLRARLDHALAGGCRIGFVPTMGALHAGHLRLIERAAQENSFTVVSIYVNPTQFNNPSDLRTYPRQPEKDLALLRSVGCDAVWFPSDDEMYPEGVSSGNFDLGVLDKVIEGHHRPGHFQGVATVVDALFRTVRPHAAYFGEKDFQQVAVIRRMVEVTGHDVEIIACPTLRESDGLALSSRNLRLSPDERPKATMLSKALFYLRDQGIHESLPNALLEARDIIAQEPEIDLEYLEVVNPVTFERLIEWPAQTEVRACISAHLGDVRLIDNVGIIA